MHEAKIIVNSEGMFVYVCTTDGYEKELGPSPTVAEIIAVHKQHLAQDPLRSPA